MWVTPRRLFGLAPTGGYRATAVASGAVGSYPTVSPLPCLPPCEADRAVCSLLPCPSPFGAQALPGSLPLELGLSSRRPCGHPATIALDQWTKDSCKQGSGKSRLRLQFAVSFRRPPTAVRQPP